MLKSHFFNFSTGNQLANPRKKADWAAGRDWHFGVENDFLQWE
jgi:hypothetical protein